jgi:hypothetical protein
MLFCYEFCQYAVVSLVHPDLESVWYDGSRPSRMDSLRSFLVKNELGRSVVSMIQALPPKMATRRAELNP